MKAPSLKIAKWAETYAGLMASPGGVYFHQYSHPGIIGVGKSISGDWLRLVLNVSDSDRGGFWSEFIASLMEPQASA
jgi:hypothetical protein